MAKTTEKAVSYPGASWFLTPDTKPGNASEIKLNREAGKPSVNLVDLGNLFAVL